MSRRKPAKGAKVNRYGFRDMFTETTEDEVRSLLEDLDFLHGERVKALLEWARGDCAWETGVEAAVSVSRLAADALRRQAG